MAVVSRLSLWVLLTALLGVSGCGRPNQPSASAPPPPTPLANTTNATTDPASPSSGNESTPPLEGFGTSTASSGPSSSAPNLVKAYTGPLLAGESQRFTGHTSAVATIAVRAGTNELYSGGTDGKLRVWDLSQGTALRQFDAPELVPGGRIAVCRNEPLVVISGVEGLGARLRVFDAASGEAHSIPLQEGGAAPSAFSGLVGPPGGRGFGANPITGLAISANGKRCFVCDATRRVFDFDPQADHTNGLAANYYPEGGVDTNPQDGTSLALSSDGRLLATAGYVGHDVGAPQLVVRLWETGTRQLRATLAMRPNNSPVPGEPGSPVVGPAGPGAFGGGFSPFEGRIAGPGMMVQLRSVDVTADGSCVLAGASDGGVYFWRLPAADDVSGKPPPAARRLNGHTGEVTGVAVLPGSQHGVSASRDGTLRFWSLNGKGKEQAKIDAGAELLCLALADDGKSVVTGSAKGTVSAWSVPTLPADDGSGSAPSPIASQESLPGWNDLVTTAIERVPAPPAGGLEGLSGINWQPRSWALTAKGPRALFARPDGYALFDAQSKSLLKHLTIPASTGQSLELPVGPRPKRGKKPAGRVVAGHLVAAALTDDGRRVIGTVTAPFDVGGLPMQLVAWDAERGTVLAHVDLPADIIPSQIAISPTGQYALAGGPGSPTAVWNVAKNTVGRGPAAMLGDCVRFSPDESRFVLVGRDDGSGAAALGIGLGGVRPGFEEGPVPAFPPRPGGGFPRGGFPGGGFPAGGEVVMDGLAAAEVWDCEPLKRWNRFNAAAGDVVAVGFLSNTEVIIAGSDSTGAHQLRVREVGSGRDLRQFTLPESEVPFTISALAVSPKGDYLATVGPAGVGSQLRLWDTAQGEECFATESQQAWSQVIFAADGQSLAGLQDTGATVWKLTPRAAGAVTSHATAPASSATFRKWSDQSGKFQVEAELIEIANGQVRLRRTDGRVVTVPATLLSADDQAYLQNLPAAK